MCVPSCSFGGIINYTNINTKNPTTPANANKPANIDFFVFMSYEIQ